MFINQFKIIFSTIVLVMTTAWPTFAQNTVAVQYWSALSLKFDKGFENVTDKYNGYEASSIKFDKKSVEIRVFKTQSCQPDMMCPQLVAYEELMIKLQVRKIESTDCYESYYASTPDGVKSAIYEQVIVNRFASERCNTLDRIRDGYIHFKVSGVSASSGEKSEAHAIATLINVRRLNLTTIPDPVFAGK